MDWGTKAMKGDWVSAVLNLPNHHFIQSTNLNPPFSLPNLNPFLPLMPTYLNEAHGEAAGTWT